MTSIKHFFLIVLYQPLFNALIFLAWLIPGHSIGWAIIALTVFIRLLLVPSSNRMLHQQRRMRDLQPKIDELKVKHGDDKATHSKAVMELYAAEKISPLGGCLPTLAQFPVLIVLYQVFIHGLSTDQFNLLYSFTPHMDVINTFWFGLNLARPEPWGLPIVAGVLQYFQARQMASVTARQSTSKQDDDVGRIMSKQMVYFLPLITVFAVRSVPAALGLYWVATIVFSLVQQAWIMRQPVEVNSGRKSGGVLVTVRKKVVD